MIVIFLFLCTWAKLAQLNYTGEKPMLSLHSCENASWLKLTSTTHGLSVCFFGFPLVHEEHDTSTQMKGVPPLYPVEPVVCLTSSYFDRSGILLSLSLNPSDRFTDSGVSLYNPASPRRPKPQANTKRLVLLMLQLMCGDVETNPGPRARSIFPCGYCELPVDWGDKALICEACEIWYHVECIEMCSEEYQRLANSSIDWICCKCHSVNPTNSLYHSYELDVSNAYAPLSTLATSSISLPSIDSSFSPTRFSSPQSTRGHLPSTSSQTTESPMTTQTIDKGMVPPKAHYWRTLTLIAFGVRG